MIIFKCKIQDSLFLKQC